MKNRATAPAQGGNQTEQRKSIKIATARQYRVMRELYRGPRCREDVDRKPGASNGPEIVAQLRRQGWKIPCEIVPHTDRDGLAGRHGVYRLSQPDRVKLKNWLSRKGVAHF